VLNIGVCCRQRQADHLSACNARVAEIVGAVVASCEAAAAAGRQPGAAAAAAADEEEDGDEQEVEEQGEQGRVDAWGARG
jgi:ribosomal protein L12E/L44/L45/RPP1/RPP2